jgi:hypothetical protein
MPLPRRESGSATARRGVARGRWEVGREIVAVGSPAYLLAKFLAKSQAAAFSVSDAPCPPRSRHDDLVRQDMEWATVSLYRRLPEPGGDRAEPPGSD